eukprot:gb/GEZN01013544.1/.p1 GENE.gb/GEZN01013544.1/~~gb/GEZN01013544.1/.p1  ORF type:complete len:296 (-),score=14.27 gb/GEZN01013544.1/:20-907(-)
MDFSLFSTNHAIFGGTILALILGCGISRWHAREPQLRFDMHIAFRPGALKALQQWVQVHALDLALQHYSRPRVGCFVQARKCSEHNISGEYEIPTFTCNFLATGFSNAHSQMRAVIEMMKQDEVLNANLLRGRTEAQFPTLLYSPQNKELAITDPREKFPARVFGHEYYDAHIHLDGILTPRQYEYAAQQAGAVSMPIITNILKPSLRPFVTVRWYNVSLEDALTSLTTIYNTLYRDLKSQGVSMALMPEFEMTKFDPDCQVTDKGWMPTPFNPFTLNDPTYHTPPPQYTFHAQS